MKTLSDEEKLRLLQDILDSREFSKSPTSKNLLGFLVKSTVAKKQLKETTIGIEIFGKQFLDQNNSSSIRVNIYNLRKKLEKYYENEGKNAKWKIIIDKGQYYTAFIHNNTIKPELKDYKSFYRISSFIAAFLFVILSFVTIKALYTPPVVLWDPFFTNEKDTTLIVGDFFGFMAITKAGRMGWNRDYQINSLDEFYEYQNEHPNFKTNVFPANYSYVTEMGSVAVYHLTRLFESRNKNFSVRFSTKSTYNDIKEHNSIYVGPTKNKNKFIQYFNERNTHFKIKDRKLYYKNLERKKDTVFDLDIEGTAYEYAIVSRLKGDKGTEQFLFFSDHDMGVIGTVELFCNLKKIKEFKKLHLKDTETFTAVFLANGKERTNLDLDLILLDKVN